jgi:hypothetical protein
MIVQPIRPKMHRIGNSYIHSIGFELRLNFGIARARLAKQRHGILKDALDARRS